MKDPIGTFLAILLVIVALALIFFGKGIQWRGLWIATACLCAVVVLVRENLTEVVLSLKQVSFKLAAVESRLSKISNALSTLMIAQPITGLGPDNTITLEFEPIPKSVRIVVGPLVHYPRPEYGYRLNGRTITIVSEKSLQQVSTRLPGGVTVEYIRKLESDDLE